MGVYTYVYYIEIYTQTVGFARSSVLGTTFLPEQLRPELKRDYGCGFVEDTISVSSQMSCRRGSGGARKLAKMKSNCPSSRSFPDSCTAAFGLLRFDTGCLCLANIDNEPRP